MQYSKRRVLRCFGTYSVFYLRRLCPEVFAFIYIVYINECKLLKAVFYIDVWKYIHNEAIQVRVNKGIT